MGESPDAQWQLTTPLNAPEQAYNYDALWNEVKNHNQSLRNQMINRLLNEQEKRIARAQLYPVLSFDAGINESDNQFEAGELAASGQTLNYFGSFSLQFNLFNGGKVRRALQNAKINEEIAQISLDEQQLTVQQDLLNAYDLYTAQLAIYRLNEQSVENQRRALDIAEDRYANRVINSFDYRAQQVSYLNAGIARAESLQNLLSTHTTLVRLRGGLIK